MQPITKFRRELGSYLREKRRKRGFTQSEVASQLGCHNQFLSNIERGVCSPPSDVLRSLVEIYDISESEVLKKLDKLQHEMWKQTLFPKKRSRRAN